MPSFDPQVLKPEVASGSLKRHGGKCSLGDTTNYRGILARALSRMQLGLCNREAGGWARSAFNLISRGP